MRRWGQVDANQSLIVKDLRKAGATVAILSNVGEGCADLLAGYRGRNFLLEVKDPSKPIGDQKLTPAQKEFHAGWKGQVCVVKTSEEALQIIQGA